MDISIKKFFIFILFTILVGLFININAYGFTYTNPENIYLTPGGETIGIELETNVIVVNTYSVYTHKDKVDPAKQAGIKPGDMILYIDGKKITKVEDIRSELVKYKNGHEKPLNIIIKRDNKLLNKKMVPINTKDNTITLGIYLRDSIMGIGTLTFVYNNQFAALGHQIQDENIPDIQLEKARGTIRKAEVISVNKSVRGNPGEKRAKFSKESIGSINENAITGIYGKIHNMESIKQKKKMKIATQKHIRLGDATILTVIERNKVEEFDVKIIDLEKQNQKDIKGIKIEITDDRLLDKTGGIIQGMSGSPIIQDDRIVGAVTHVLIDDTTMGYGVYIEFMLEDLGIEIR